MVFKPLTQLSCRFAGHPSDILKNIKPFSCSRVVSNPAGFKADLVTHYVPLKVLNTTEITVTQSLIFSPQTFMSLGML